MTEPIEQSSTEAPPIVPAPPIAEGETSGATPPDSFRSRAAILRRTSLWLTVCTVCAIPSFLWAVDEFDRRAMVLGIVLFAMAMTAVTSTNRFYRFSRRPFIRRTLYIGYGIRIAVSVIFPIGMSVDLPSGLMITGIISEFFSQTNPNYFLLTLLSTLLQGTALNIILAVVMVPIWAIQRTTMIPRAITTTSCARCGYDLVATMPGAPCPECGSTSGLADFDSTPLTRQSEYAWGLYVLAGLSVLALVMIFFVFQGRVQ